MFLVPMLAVFLTARLFNAQLDIVQEAVAHYTAVPLNGSYEDVAEVVMRNHQVMRNAANRILIRHVVFFLAEVSYTYLGLPMPPSAMQRYDSLIYNMPMSERALYSDAICRAASRNEKAAGELLDDAEADIIPRGSPRGNAASAGNIAYMALYAITPGLRARAMNVARLMQNPTAEVVDADRRKWATKQLVEQILG